MHTTKHNTSNNTTCLPVFSVKFMYPRYWLIWIGIGILWLIVQLPYPIIYYLGHLLGRFSLFIMKRRVQIAYRNLELCFPKMNKQERRIMITKNFESVGMALMEIGMAWFWSNKRIIRWVEITGIGTEPVKKILEKKHGILLIGIHFLTLEIGARTFGMYTPGIGVYRPNNNPLLNWLQSRGRLRSNKTMLENKNLKGMIRALKNGEIVWYAPDHDYGPQSSTFVPFFAVEKTATTTGTWILIRSSKSIVIPFVPRRKPHGKGYELIILEPEYEPPISDAETTARWMNNIIEKCIMLAPDQYMWLHRRFKTCPHGTSSRYLC